MADASRRVGTLALVLLGPLLVLGKCALEPEGDAFPAVDRTARGIHLVLLSVEGVSAEDVRLFDPEAPSRPALASLSSLGISVLSAYAASDQSPAAVTSLVTSRLPTGHGVLHAGLSLDPSAMTLPRRLAQAGYQTAGFSNLPIFSTTGLGQGLQSAVERVGADALDLIPAVTDWLGGIGDGPFFLWLHAHAGLPSSAPANDPGARMDALAGALVSALHDARRFEGSLVVVVGASGRPVDGARGPALAVPLILKMPRRASAGALRTGVFSTLDLAPTLLSFLHLEPLPSAVGRPLSGRAPDPLLTGRGFESNAPFEIWTDPRQHIGLSVRTWEAMLLDGLPYSLREDSDLPFDLSRHPSGQVVRATLGPLLEQLRPKLGEPLEALPVQIDAATLERLPSGWRPPGE